MTQRYARANMVIIFLNIAHTRAVFVTANFGKTTMPNHRLNQPTPEQFRPSVGIPYRSVLVRIAAEMNKTSRFKFTALGVLRHAVYLLWQKELPDEPFPIDADELRTPFQRK